MHQEFNPYAAPTASLTDHAPPAGERRVGHYRMSPTKLFVMTVLSFGVYERVWGWRQWRAVRDIGGGDVAVFARTLFLGFTLFDLRSRIHMSQVDADVEAPDGLSGLAEAYLALGIGGNITFRVIPDDGPLLILAIMLVLVLASAAIVARTQSAINATFEAAGDTTPANAGLTPWSLALGLVGGLAWMVIVGGNLLLL